MGIPTLIKTLTASGDSSLSFVDGTSSVVFDSTYDEYMFVITDINVATDQAQFMFQFNAAGASGYNEALVTTCFQAYHLEDDSGAGLGYLTPHDLVGTTRQELTNIMSNDADATCAGILHVWSPASTTYVTHFYARTSNGRFDDYALDWHVAGYVNATAAIDEIQFTASSGDFDGVIQMYGIA